MLILPYTVSIKVAENNFGFKHFYNFSYRKFTFVVIRTFFFYNYIYLEF